MECWLSVLGARPQAASVLSRLQELKAVRDDLTAKEAELHKAEDDLSGMKGIADK